jgi:hypothetical protein
MFIICINCCRQQPIDLVAEIVRRLHVRLQRAGKELLRHCLVDQPVRLYPAAASRKLRFRSATTVPSGAATKRISSSGDPLSRVTMHMRPFTS